MPHELISLLGQDEIDALYEIPRFSHREREYFFHCPGHELAYSQRFRKTHSQVIYIVQVGYFRAKTLFFHLTWMDTHQDIAYVIQRYFPGYDVSTFPVDHLDRIARRQHKSILVRFGYQKYHNDLDAHYR